MSQLGSNQRSVLKALVQHARDGRWYHGCGWIWDSPSVTAKILRSLEKRGLVSYQIDRRGSIYGEYQITLAGLKEIETSTGHVYPRLREELEQENV